jgi:hypothetical protein
MAFIRNNIRYRSAASKAMEGYYNSKAFILNELINPDNGFSSTAKEVVLLLFNKHTDWLSYSEHLLLDKTVIGQDEIDSMQVSLGSIAIAINRTFNENSEVFDSLFIRHWTHIHYNNLRVMKSALAEAEGMPQIIAFPYAAECLVEYLNTTLFEIYELDCLLGSNFVKEQTTSNNSQPEKLILFIDDGSLSQRSAENKQPELERFTYYVDELIDKEKRFCVEVRDYSCRAENEQIRERACEEVRHHLTNMPQIKSFNVVRPNE